jgi:hypothetical protein
MVARASLEQSKLLARVQQSLLGGGERGPAAAARPRVSRVAHLDHVFAPPQGPVQPEAGEDEGEGPEAAPAGLPPVGAAAAGVVGAGLSGAAVRLGAVVKQGLDAAQTRGVVDDGVGGEQAAVVAHPPLGQRPRLLAGVAPAPTALRAHDGGPGDAFGRRRRRLLAKRRRRRLLRDGGRRQGEPRRPLVPGRLGWWRRRWRLRRSERRFHIFVGRPFVLWTRGGERYRRLRPQRC